MSITTVGPQLTDTEESVGNILAGKYLTFKLGEEEFGIQILSVNQIIQMQPITSIPKTPAFVRGVINLRGMIIPIIDLRKKFGMSVKEDTDRTCIVVVQVGTDEKFVKMGIVIDEVKEVREIASDDIEEKPPLGIEVDTEFILGIGKANKSVIVLLDINKLLTNNELSALKNL